PPAVDAPGAGELDPEQEVARPGLGPGLPEVLAPVDLAGLIGCKCDISKGRAEQTERQEGAQADPDPPGSGVEHRGSPSFGGWEGWGPVVRGAAVSAIGGAPHPWSDRPRFARAGRTVGGGSIFD